MTVPPERQTRLEQVLPWALRVVLVLVPFTLGEVVDAWLDDASEATATFGTVAVWATWAVTMVAALVPLPITLTWLRVVTPAWTAIAVWAAIDDANGALAVLSLVVTMLATALAFHAVIGDRFVDGASYGDERRFLLRYPGQLVIGPLQITWAALVAAVLAGPVLLATQRWVLGTVVCVVGAAVAFFAWRAVHSLHRRWVVMVPAGFVLHDPTSIREPVLFSRNDVMAFGLAPADFAGRDLTAVSLGLAVRARLRTAATVYASDGDGEAAEVEEFAFAPARPGAVLKEAKARRLPIA